MRNTLSQRSNYKWWVFGAVAISTFLSVVDHGSVLVVLPEIALHFKVNLPTVQWVVIGYALAISALLLPMGRLGDLMGRKYIFLGGFALFVLGAALAGLSPTLPLLIAAKVFQGIGSAMIQGNGMALVLSVFPGSERGKALGSHLSFVGAGSVAGPALGGLIASAFGWQWVFFMNVPIGVASIVVAFFVLKGLRQESGRRSKSNSFDWLGAVLSGGALLLFLLAVGNGHELGWTSAIIVSAGIGFIAALTAFVWWELRAPSPMLELRLFQRKVVAMGVSAGWISFLGSQAARFMMPFYLQRVLDYSPREVGLFMIPPALCMIVFGPISGRLSDRFGWRTFTVGGLSLGATAAFIFAFGLTERTPVLLIIGLLMAQSVGMGLFNSPNNSSILSAVERSRYGVVTALTQLVRNSANVTSVAVTTTIVVVTMGSMGVAPSLDAVSPEVAGAFVTGLRRAFFVLGCLMVVGVFLSLAKGERAAEGEASDKPAAASAPAAKPAVAANPRSGGD